jgi:hypothetical protein
MNGFFKAKFNDLRASLKGGQHIALAGPRQALKQLASRPHCLALT